jgi:thiamine biosynthesis lipoprotein
MGTFVAIEVRHADEGRGAEAIAAAFDNIGAIERALHPEHANSDLAAIRHAPLGTPVRVEQITRDVLQLAREVWEKSSRVFDPCLPDAPGSMADLVFYDEHLAAREQVHIDLGGIAKGYAVDLAVETLMAAGCDMGVVNAGGDMRVFGPEPIEVVVKCGERQQRRFLNNSAIAVSDTCAPSFPSEHRGYYRRGASSNLFARGAIVCASRTAVADALTKCLLLGDPIANESLLRAFNASGEVF